MTIVVHDIKETQVKAATYEYVKQCSRCAATWQTPNPGYDYCPGDQCKGNAIVVKTIRTQDDTYTMTVSYSTETEDDLEYKLPMTRFENEELGPYWDVDTKKLTPFERELWDAAGDAAVAYADERFEG